MGLYPRKGAIAAGSDADIAILDPSRRGKVRKEDLHETDYTPWEGHDIFAWPMVTILRGKVVVENGQFLGREGAGQYLKRKIRSRDHRGAVAVKLEATAAAHELLVQSLKAWHVRGDVARVPDGALLLTAGEVRVRIARSPDTPPFRWMVDTGDRTRGVVSIAGLLRAVRAAVDPAHRPVRLRIAPLPLVVP